MNTYIPFTYLIGWSHLNTWYYGRKTEQGCCPNDLWTTYFTSSDEVNEFRIKNGEPDIIQIRKIFPNNPKACCDWEDKVLDRMNVMKDDRFLNKKNGAKNFDTTGMVTVKDSFGNIVSVSINDPRYLNGDLVGVTKGLIPVKDFEGKTYMVTQDNEKYISGEYIHVTTGLVPVRDKNGSIFCVNKDDPRYLNGELTHTKKGLVTVKDKDEKILTVQVDDPRYISGELIHVNKGKYNKQNNPNAKKYKIISPENVVYYVEGNYKTFCEENKLDMKKLREGKLAGWVRITL
jgi:hypothetical protein